MHYPPLITRTSECKFCFQRNVCSLAALSIEDVHPQGPRRKGPQGQFPAFLEMQASLIEEVKAYFKRYVECINLEQNAETERFTSSSQTGGGRGQLQSGAGRETKLRITKIESNGGDGVRIELEKLY